MYIYCRTRFFYGHVERVRLLSVELDAAGCVNTVQMLPSVETDAAGCRDRCCWVKIQIMLGVDTYAAGC